MKDKIYTLYSGIKIYILNETDLNSKHYVMCAIVDSVTDQVTEQICILEYNSVDNDFLAVEDRALLIEISKNFM
ncbi:MAG: hypothetical protein R3Y13_01605 [bacterium]